MTNLIAKNSIFGFFQVILTSILTLISVPILISKLGLELYGIFAVVSVIGNLNVLTNFGLNTSILVFISKQGKSKESNTDIFVITLFLIFLSFIFLLVFIITQEFLIIQLMNIPIKHVSDCEVLLLYLIISNSILLIGQTFTAVLDALNKNYLTNIYQFIYSCIYWIGILIIVSFQGGLIGIGKVALFSSIIWFLLILFQFKIHWGFINSFSFFDFLPTLKKHLSYGSKIYGAGLVGFLFEPLSKILISNFIGLNYVAFYEVGLKVKNQLNSIFFKIIYPIVPSLTKGDFNTKLNVFYISKFIHILIVPIFIVFYFTIDYFSLIWLGSKDSENAFIFIKVLTGSMILFVPTSLPIYLYLSANNMANKNIKIQFISVIVNIVVFFIFLNIFNEFSVLLSNFLGLLSAFIMCQYYLVLFLEGQIKISFKIYYQMFIYFVVNFLIITIINELFLPKLFSVMFVPVLVFLSFLILVYYFNIFSKDNFPTWELSTYFGQRKFK